MIHAQLFNTSQRKTATLLNKGPTFVGLPPKKKLSIYHLRWSQMIRVSVAFHIDSEHGRNASSGPWFSSFKKNRL
jgi:hypothetical protein